MLRFSAPRPGWIGVLIVLLLIILFRASGAAELFSTKSCFYCSGTGSYGMPFLAGNPGRSVDCIHCWASGDLWPLRIFFIRHGIVGFTWLLILALLSTGAAFAFKVTDCRVCRTRGCRRCQRRGWLTVIDRWVTRV